ncbi:hypothetical protein RSSM_00736 [Rhodopirellula sallentina SM41]|uniref:Uncharacterized protein n=2 Tax=Rhodopirellula TaxID=265488 RepID=M5U974_9BACT|nr:hypothetical protein RSSM_00736 [Rhodopirellula sallentina SM41]
MTGPLALNVRFGAAKRGTLSRRKTHPFCCVDKMRGSGRIDSINRSEA